MHHRSLHYINPTAHHWINRSTCNICTCHHPRQPPPPPARAHHRPSAGIRKKPPVELLQRCALSLHKHQEIVTLVRFLWEILWESPKLSTMGVMRESIQVRKRAMGTKANSIGARRFPQCNREKTVGCNVRNDGKRKADTMIRSLLLFFSLLPPSLSISISN